MSIKRRRVFTFNINTALLEAGAGAGVPANNTDLSSCVIPAGREITIYAVKADVRAAGAAASTIELCDASDNVLAEVAVSATGIVEDSTASRFPIRFKNSSDSAATTLKFRVNGTLDSTTAFTLEAHMDEPDFA